MADLYGAPLGAIAYHKDALTQMQTAAQAADISLTPARKKLLEAQAGSAEALATGRRAESGVLVAASGWDTAYRKAQVKKERTEAIAIMGPIGAGRQVTVADLPPDEYAPDNPQLKQAAWLRKNGAPHAIWGSIQDQGIENDRKESMIYYREAQAEKLTTENEIKRDKQLGEMAHDAITSPLIWMNIVQDPKLNSQLPPQMKGMSHEQAIPLLKHIARGATSKVEEQKAILAEKKDERAKTLAGQTSLYYNSKKAEADARTAMDKYRLDQLQKNDGHSSKSAQEASEALVESRRLQTLMNRMAIANPMPIDPDELLEKNDRGFPVVYTSRDGNFHGYFRGMDENDVPIWDPVSPSEMKRLLQAAEGEEDVDIWDELDLKE